MLPIYIGVYIVLLIAVWGFFFVARHHTLKFKKFSTNITPATNMLLIFLIILSLTGFISLFFLGENNGEVRIDREVQTIQNYY